MSDHSELKKAAEACGPLPWRLIEIGLTRLGVRDDHGFIAFMDIGHPAKYGPCPDREAKARFIGHATPAAVLGLIAEIDRLCSADELKGRIEREILDVWEKQGIPNLRDENRRLKAENESLRKDAERYRYVSELAWYVERGAQVYNLCNVNARWSSDRGSPDRDDVEQAVDSAMTVTIAADDPLTTCLECFGAGTISTGIEEASSTICNACGGTGKQEDCS